jgi:hypothetical protein
MTPTTSLNAAAPSDADVPPGSAIVSLYVRAIDQLFNNLDPAPFHEKGLGSDAEEYIVSLAEDLPKDRPLALVVHVDQRAAVAGDAGLLATAIDAHFARRAQATAHRLRQLFRNGRISLAIGLLFLGGGVVAAETIVRSLDYRPFTLVVRESLLIGGWVAMWHPLEIFLYDWWPIRAKRRLYERLSRMPVRIVHAVGELAAGEVKQDAADARTTPSEDRTLRAV